VKNAKKSSGSSSKLEEQKIPSHKYALSKEKKVVKRKQKGYNRIMKLH
jgi:hypothetical protein